MHFNISKSIVLCCRLEEDGLLTSGDLHFRRFFVKCAGRVRVCNKSKHSTEILSIIGDNLLLRHELNGVVSDMFVRVYACSLSPIFVVVDRFATGFVIGYYLGQKSK